MEACELDPAGAGRRLRSVVGSRRARIALDDDVVDVWLAGSTIVVGPPKTAVPVDGSGSTTTATVVAMLAGDLEVSAALHAGLIEATGRRDSITRLFHAIEIILDASTRVASLRRLADDFLADATESQPHLGRVENRAAERRLLDRLGLLGERA